MYEAELKAILIAASFPPKAGWKVNVHLDPMERCRGGSHPPGKKAVVDEAIERLNDLGVQLGVDRAFGVDINARHPRYGHYLIEAKGESSLQKELALYSALGQLLMKIGEPPWAFKAALAFPDTDSWIGQVNKIPSWLVNQLKLDVYLVGAGTVPKINNESAKPCAQAGGGPPLGLKR